MNKQAMECSKCHRTSVVAPLKDKCPFCEDNLICANCNRSVIPPEPMGVGQWKEYGLKYGYWNYFEKQAKEEERRELMKNEREITTSAKRNKKMVLL